MAEKIKSKKETKDPIKESVMQESAAKNSAGPSGEGKLAVILVRGLARISKPIYDTLIMLRLTRKNRCVVIDNTFPNKGMLNKVKDFIAWGEINEETFKELLQKRGEEYSRRVSDGKGKYRYKTLNVDGKHYYPYFALNPPRQGFGRKGIKVSFKSSGALGYQGEKINDLITRML